MYIGSASRPLLLPTAGAGVAAGATWPAAAVVGFAAAAGALDGLAGLPHAARSVAPRAVPPTWTSSARRVSLDILILCHPEGVCGIRIRPHRCARSLGGTTFSWKRLVRRTKKSSSFENSLSKERA